MKTVFVTYPGDSTTRFDRQSYVRKHLRLVTAAWEPHGMQSIAAFFPTGTGEGTIAVCVCEFRDDEAISASFHAPETKAVMEDVPHFTDAKPRQLQTRGWKPKPGIASRVLPR